MTPDAMQRNLDKLGVLKQYDLGRPQPQMKIYHVPDYQNVVQILKDEADSQTTYTECASHVLPTING